MLNLGAYRNRVFISRRIQGRLVARVALYWVLYHVVLWHGMLLYRCSQSRMSGAGGGQFPGLFDDQVRQLASDFFPVLLCGLLTLPVVLIDMLHVSHRIAGPLVHFRRVLRELMDGRKVDRVALRRRDLLTEFQEDFNQYLATLENQSPGSALRAAVLFPTRREAQHTGTLPDLPAPVPAVSEQRGGMAEVPPIAGPQIWAR
jgi:hypothetical protein